MIVSSGCIRSWLRSMQTDRDKHTKIINRLVVQAALNEPVANARMAAAIVWRNQIISFGLNELKSHPFQAKYSKNKDSIFLHAETSAIKNALLVLAVPELSRASLYIARVKYDSPQKNNLIWGLAKPCAGCMKAIVAFGISNVCYTTNEQTFEWLSHSDVSLFQP